MPYNADCMQCAINRAYNMVKDHPDREKRDKFLFEVARLGVEAKDGYTPTDDEPYVAKLRKEMFGIVREMSDVKIRFNKILLEIEDELVQMIAEAADPFETAIKLSRLGNYIDPSTVKNPDPKVLIDRLKAVDEEELDQVEYENFKRELSEAKRFVLLCDNAGEIVLDKLLMRELSKAYPELQIDVIVRGMDIVNDATMDDAIASGMAKEFKVTGNGAGIPGNRLETISEEARNLIKGADVVLSKGQGNAETLMGCGLNIYYSFLTKCNLFVNRTGLPLMTGAFINERRWK